MVYQFGFPELQLVKECDAVGLKRGVIIRSKQTGLLVGYGIMGQQPSVR